MKLVIGANGLPVIELEGQEDINMMASLFNGSSPSIFEAYGVNPADRIAVSDALRDASTQRPLLNIFLSDDVSQGGTAEEDAMPTRDEVRQLRLEDFRVDKVLIENNPAYTVSYSEDKHTVCGQYDGTIRKFLPDHYATVAKAWRAACINYKEQGFSFI